MSPRTIVGIVSFTGGATGAEFPDEASRRFAPQRLQYLNSAEISLPQDGQYITPPDQKFILRKGVMYHSGIAGRKHPEAKYMREQYQRKRTQKV
ncbi:MAG: hypothetical protein ABR501_00590 [Pyrinomonadaceae bacterium]